MIDSYRGQGPPIIPIQYNNPANNFNTTNNSEANHTQNQHGFNNYGTNDDSYTLNYKLWGS